MDRIKITGGQRLNGRIQISGAKNAALPLLIASLLTADRLTLKNVPNLVVKVFEINTQNFYRQNLREIDTDINLDGLVANAAPWRSTE